MTTDAPSPERVETVRRLRLMADQGDFGRKPDPDDIRRKAANLLEASAAEIERLKQERDEARSWGEGWRLRCRDREAETIAAEAESARLREAAIKAALCLSGFAGESIFIEGYEYPEDAYCRLTEALGMPDADDDALRAALAAGTSQEVGR